MVDDSVPDCGLNDFIFTFMEHNEFGFRKYTRPLLQGSETSIKSEGTIVREDAFSLGWEEREGFAKQKEFE